MAAGEYRKIIDVLARSLGAGNSVELNYAHDTNHKIDVIDVALKTAEGEDMECRVYLRPDFLEIGIPKKFFTPKKYAKFISRFEYDLEQHFFRNMHLISSEEGAEYKVRVEY